MGRPWRAGAIAARARSRAGDALLQASHRQRSSPGRPLLRGIRFVLVASSVLVCGCARSAYDLGRRALDDGDAQAAIAYFDSSIATGRTVFAATRDRGEAHLKAGDVERALADLEAARQIEPSDARLLWLLGEAYTAAHRFQDAAKDYEAYGLATDERGAQRLARRKVAQLRAQHAADAARLLGGRLDRGVKPEDNTVAVFAFVPSDSASVQDQEMCRALNVLVTADLLKVEALRAIAADQLDILYRERRCDYECRQYLDPASVVAQNDILPARFMVRGTYGTLPKNQMFLGAHCFDAKTQQSSVCVPPSTGGLADFFRFEAGLVLDLLGTMGIQPTPSEEAAIRRKPTENLRAFMVYAHGLYLQERGDYEGAGAAFQQAAQQDRSFSLAADAATAAEIVGQPPIVVEPPVQVDPVTQRAMSSAVQLGLGLIPDEDTGQSTDASTGDVVSVHGNVNVRITARAGPR